MISPALIPSPEVTSNIDAELNKRGLSLAGNYWDKIIRLRRAVKSEKGKEVSETGEVKYKKEFKPFPKLPLELRRMIWKQAIPVFPYRIITVRRLLDDDEPFENPSPPIITIPSHPALDLMLTCKEFKEVLYEECFPHVKNTEGNNLTEDNETLEVVSFKTKPTPSSQSRLVNYDTDIFYIIAGVGGLEILVSDSPFPLPLMKRIMLADLVFDELMDTSWQQIGCVFQNLRGLEQIVLLDFPEPYFPEHYIEPAQEPARDDSHDGTVWANIKSAKSLDRYHVDEYDDNHTLRFHNWVSEQESEAENDSSWSEFDKKTVEELHGLKVYYTDPSIFRVGPVLAVKDEDRYEFSFADRTWYSVTTGLAAVTD